MFKTLLKKQFLELNKYYFQNNKTKAARSKGSTIGMIILFAALFLMLGAMFYMMGYQLSGPLFALDLHWLYFAIMALMSILLGTFGSVFNTYSSLYKSKDNDLLLSMPIPPIYILLARMTGVFGMSFLYSSLAWIPAIICYWVTAGVTVAGVISQLVLIVVLTVFVSALTSVFGWLVAIISTKIKKKSIISMIFSVLFLGIYYFVCFRFQYIIQTIAENAEKIGETIKTKVSIFYVIGLAGTGNILYLLLFTGISVALFALCFYVLSKTFIKITTSSTGGKKVEYKEKQAKKNSVSSALLKKELKRFVGSTTYMLNSGLGILILPVLGVLAIIKGDFVTEYFGVISSELPFLNSAFPGFITTAICMIVSMNVISAPSIALEGKNLQILKAMPIDPADILRAKENLHIVLNIIPAVFANICCGIAFKYDIISFVGTTAIVVIYVLFTAVFGLLLGLHNPVLDWADESVPTKRSTAVAIALFGGWGCSFLIGAGALALSTMTWVYYIAVSVVFAITYALLHHRLVTKGAKKLDSLS